jgi:hypothetical protein
MPIDINAILTPFVTPFKHAWKSITDAMESIARQVAHRLEHANAMERASRDFPMLDFRDGAVVVSVAKWQEGALGPPPPESAIPASIRQELLLPRLFDTLRQMTGSIRDAIARFQTPSREMFSTQNTHFVDIFGHVGMLVRAFAEDYRPVRLLETTGKEARKWYDSLKLSSGETSASSGDALESLPGKLAGALILIPAFMDWMTALIGFLDLAIRTATLDQMEQIQAQVYGLRRTILDNLFFTIREMAQNAYELYYVADRILLHSALYWGRFLTIYLQMLGEQISSLSEFLHKWVNLVIAVLSAISHMAEGLRGITLPGGITFGDIIDAVSGRAANFLQDQLDVLKRIPNDTIQNIANIYSALLRAAAGVPAPVYPTVPPLPDLYAAAIAPYESQLFGLIRDLHTNAVPAITQILQGGSDTLSQVAEDTSRAARTAINIPTALWNNVVDSSSHIADRLYGGQSRDQREDPLAQAYERAIVTAGFATINEVIPRYIGGVIDWWRNRRRARNRGEVSQHILNRRGRLYRVRVARMQIRLHDFDIALLKDDDWRAGLIEAFQNRMKEKVEETWSTGELQGAPA